MNAKAAAAYLITSGSGGRRVSGLEGQLYTQGGLVYDQTKKPRRVMFYTDMGFQRLLADGRPEATAGMESAVKAGRHGARFCYTGPTEHEENYGGYWKGLVTTPEAAKDTLILAVKALAQRGLYSHIFGSFNFDETGTEGAAREIAFHEWMGPALRREGLGRWIMYEWRNEWNLTSPYGGGWNEQEQILGSEETYRVAAQCIQIMQRELGCVCTMGSPGEEDNSIAASITKTGATLAAIDFGRGYSGDLMMKHAHRAYYDGRYHGKYQGAALWVTEPAGPDSELPPHDSYAPLNDPAYLFGMHAIYALTGQACTYFNGPGVRHHQPVDSTVGFYEHPKLFQFFPEDIGLWKGPTWFLNPNNPKEFYTVVAEEWFLLERPPLPFKKWQVLFHDGQIVEGSGPIVLTPGWKACAVHGEFA